MNEHDRPIAWPVGVADDLPERFWAGEGAESAVEETEGTQGAEGSE